MTPIEQFRVLVVDNSEPFLASMVRWIASCPELVVVGTARHASEALNAVKRLSPDLVIVEAVLRGIDGFHLTRMIKARPNPPHVVVVTFHASAAARDEAYSAGADGFLAKYDFSDGIESIVGGWAANLADRARGVTTPSRPAPRGSQNVPDR